MRIFTFEDKTFHVSEDMIKDSLKILTKKDDPEYFIQLELEALAKNFIDENPIYHKYAKEYSKKHNLSNYIFLHAHGFVEDKRHYFVDGNKRRLLQNWINKYDGKYALMILATCNEGAAEVKSKKTPFIMPNNTYSGILKEMGKVNVELFVPGKGYISNYVIKKELEDIINENESN